MLFCGEHKSAFLHYLVNHITHIGVVPAEECGEIITEYREPLANKREGGAVVSAADSGLIIVRLVVESDCENR